MAPETWLIKLKTMFSTKRTSTRSTPPPPKPPKKQNVGVLAFEIARLLSKLLHLWHSLSDKQLSHLKTNSLSLIGIRKVVSNDESFLLTLAFAELILNLKTVADSVSRISKKSAHQNLRAYEYLISRFADCGEDPNNWVLSLAEMELHNKKVDRVVKATTVLFKEMQDLASNEMNLRKAMLSKEQEKIVDLQQKILIKKQEIKYLKGRSLWDRSFDTATSLLAKSVFTVLARIKLVSCMVPENSHPCSLPHSQSTSATVHPFGPLTKGSNRGFFESNLELLKPPSSTLGATALALHYSNLIILIEKMIKSPQLVGSDAREDLYSILPYSIRSCLRARLKGIGFSATDPVLAGEWRDALGKILGWLAPLARNMMTWQSERSFEQHHNLMLLKTNVLLLQTLFFANREKTEAAITELLVGLNYIWRFEKEMNAKALF